MERGKTKRQDKGISRAYITRGPALFKGTGILTNHSSLLLKDMYSRQHSITETRAHVTVRMFKVAIRQKERMRTCQDPGVSGKEEAHYTNEKSL